MFAEKPMSLRRQHGLSQEQLGQRIGVSRQAISKWETGQTTPELSKLMELARVFGCSIDHLVDAQDGMDAPAEADVPEEPKPVSSAPHYEYRS